MPRIQSQTQQPMSTRPFMTPEGQENYLVSLANNLVERRMLDGTASSQETTHFLKIGSVKERQEREKLEEEIKLLRAKTEAIGSEKHQEILYSEAISAMRRYSGQGEPDEDY